MDAKNMNHLRDYICALPKAPKAAAAPPPPPPPPPPPNPGTPASAAQQDGSQERLAASASQGAGFDNTLMNVGGAKGLVAPTVQTQKTGQ